MSRNGINADLLSRFQYLQVISMSGTLTHSGPIDGLQVDGRELVIRLKWCAEPVPNQEGYWWHKGRKAFALESFRIVKFDSVHAVVQAPGYRGRRFILQNHWCLSPEDIIGL